jgi:hypothetical protein
MCDGEKIRTSQMQKAVGCASARSARRPRPQHGRHIIIGSQDVQAPNLYACLNSAADSRDCRSM